VNQKPRADKDENKKVENFQNIPPFEIYIWKQWKEEKKKYV
jgi:hypothetical protein